MTLRIGAPPISPMPQRVLDARNALVHNLVRTQAKAAEHHELAVEQKQRARQYVAGEQLTSTKQALKASLVPTDGANARRAIKRALRARRRAALHRLIPVSSSRAAREARRELTESLAASQMIADSIRRQGLAHTPMSSDLFFGQWPRIDIASSPRKLRGPNPAGRPRLVVRLRELPF